MNDTPNVDGDNERLEAALDFARAGFFVLPISRTDKGPDTLLVPNGFKNATRDLQVIADWFAVHPHANVAVAVGVDYGVVVLDVDVKHGAQGMETLRTLNGVMDRPTLTAATPSGGLHLYFIHPGVPLKKKLSGIDIKGAEDGGGYVLAPPSVLPEGAYRWRDREIPVVEFPENLLEQLRADAPDGEHDNVHGNVHDDVHGGGNHGGNGARDPGPDPVSSIKTPEGQRHSRLVELGAIYRGKGLSEEEIETLLWHYALHYFEPPFSRDSPADVREIEAVVHWYAGKEANEEASAEDLKVLTTVQLRQLAKAMPEQGLLEPLLPQAGSLMIYGAAGIGKSHIALCAAGALALGRSFLDWSVASAVPVLFVDGEMPLDELSTRVRAYFGEDEALRNLTWIAARAQQTDLPNLADPQQQERYYAAVCTVGAQVVVFDNLSALRTTSVMLPENAKESWDPVAKFFRRLNRRNVAVILAHHAGRSGQQRGSTDHVALFDTVLALHALGGGQADPLAECDVEFEFEKHRRFGGEAAASFRAKAICDEAGRVTWQRVGADPLVDDVVRLRLQGMSVRHIAKTLKRSKNGIEKAITRAKARGLLPLGGPNE